MSGIFIIGSGSWGTAITNVLAENNGNKGKIHICCRDSSVADEINQFHTNQKYLAGIRLNDGIEATTDLHELKGAKIVFVVIPVGALGNLFDLLKEQDLLPEDAIVVICSKGVEHKLGLFPTQIFASYFPSHKVCYLSGPNIAQEIALKLPTATDISCKDLQVGQMVASKLFTKYLRTYVHDDVIGSQICACFKNVLAVASGVCEGREMGGNARAALLTRGVAELCKIIEAFGGKSETIFSLSGIGDIFLTCSNIQSRNMKFGLDIATGKSPAEEASKKLVEGYHSCKYIPIIENKFNLELPIFMSIYNILYKGQSLDLAIDQLLSRPREKHSTL